MSADDPSPERLRAGISRGTGRDKVSFPDPSSAPLGSDEEAAGTPVTASAVQLAADHEARAEPQPVVEGSEPTAGAGIAAGTISLLAAAVTVGVVALITAAIWKLAA